MWQVTYTNGMMQLTQPFSTEAAARDFASRNYGATVRQVGAGVTKNTASQNNITITGSAGLQAPKMITNVFGQRVPAPTDAERYGRASVTPLTEDQKTIADLKSQLEAYTSVADRAASEKAAAVTRDVSVLKATLGEAHFTEKQINQIISSSRAWLNSGFSVAEILTTKMPELQAYKDRFPANAIREKNGLPAYSMSSYLAMESEYGNLLMQYEDILPGTIKTRNAKGNFVLPKDLVTNWMANGVSATEAETRFQIADAFVGSLNPDIKASLNKYFNLDDKDITKIVLYQASNKSAKTLQTTETGAAALGQGLQDISLDVIQKITGKGVSNVASQQAFGEVAKEQDVYNMAGAIQGVSVTQNELALSELGLDAEAKKKMSKIKDVETATWSATGGGTNILGTQSTSGSI